MGNRLICDCEELPVPAVEEYSVSTKPLTVSSRACAHLPEAVDEALDENHPGTFYDPADVFDFDVVKDSPQEPLGMDVKHAIHTLVVAHIFKEGAIARTNALNLKCDPPKEVLQVGDVIQRVNGVSRSDDRMVAECRRGSELKMQVARL
mmetsp:Transcript_24062/g.71944  ORF Transcript_24062/g.71944 Transcript_24062/m.71944 type:complete len:149 (-) Transcript_24062:35-481(-)